MDQPKRISVAVGRTYNIGNYESLRLDYGIEFPAGTETPIKQQMDEAAEKLLDFVDAKASHIVKRIRG